MATCGIAAGSKETMNYFLNNLEKNGIQAVVTQTGCMGYCFAEPTVEIAASLVAGEIAHSKGYAAVLYLDPKEKKYLDECGPANFFGIRGNSYITPQSHSILPSITNKSLQQLAEDMGLTVERRPVPFEEIATFDEAAECGTAAVIAPISQIDDLDENKSFVIAKDGKPGPVCEKLYHKLRAIQYGDEPDTYGWISIIE